MVLVVGIQAQGDGALSCVIMDVKKELSGAEKLTTNNRMELMAAIKSLQALKRKCRVDLYTDSQYVRRGMTEWLKSWKLKQWRNSQNKPVKNADLWQELIRSHRNMKSIGIG